jgi:hypothetical protein
MTVFSVSWWRAMKACSAAVVSAVRARRRRRGRPAFDDERGRPLEAAERRAPERLGLRLVLTAQPRDVVAVGARALKPRRLAAAEALVEREDLLQEEGAGPAVEQEVVVAHDELVLVVAQTDEREAEQRRAREVEGAPLVRLEKFFEAAGALALLKPAPVVKLKRRLDLSVDDLHGRLDLLPVEGSAQDGVAADGLAPRAPEGVVVDGAPHRAAQLAVVDVRARGVEAVQQHPLLHRRELVDVLDVVSLHP